MLISILTLFASLAHGANWPPGKALYAGIHIALSAGIFALIYGWKSSLMVAILCAAYWILARRSWQADPELDIIRNGATLRGAAILVAAYVPFYAVCAAAIAYFHGWWVLAIIPLLFVSALSCYLASVERIGVRGEGARYNRLITEAATGAACGFAMGGIV